MRGKTWETGIPSIGAVYVDDAGCVRCVLDGRKVESIYSTEGNAEPVRFDIDSRDSVYVITPQPLRIDPTWTDRVLDVVARMRAILRILRS